jgi:hypothetical protein
MTNYEIASLSLFRKAASGHPKAIELAFKRYEKAYRELSMRAAQKPKEEFSWAEEQEELFQQLEKMTEPIEKEKDEPDA